jgi:bifunctional UDP-N-acetylglucosamine pyrophosphorylase/glucosamine-1-phosphate N-acetyltransferase
VETKNAVLGAGGKANHLAYLGDARIGREVNVGAGTITCNYDGFRKHRTTVGDRVQIGSDSQLVAPVRVGDDAYVATATTVRKDVAAGALVFNARQQLQRAGWVEARRKREEAGAAAKKTKARARKTGKQARKAVPSGERRHR